VSEPEGVVEMAARIVLTNGDDFVVDVEVNEAASDILSGDDRFATFDARRTGGKTKRVHVIREHIAYAEEYFGPQPSAARA
jgi:hypothetical protein